MVEIPNKSLSYDEVVEIAWLINFIVYHRQPNESDWKHIKECLEKAGYKKEG